MIGPLSIPSTTWEIRYSSSSYDRAQSTQETKVIQIRQFSQNRLTNFHTMFLEKNVIK